jgi:hypothetical protein
MTSRRPHTKRAVRTQRELVRLSLLLVPER